MAIGTRHLDAGGARECYVFGRGPHGVLKRALTPPPKERIVLVNDTCRSEATSARDIGTVQEVELNAAPLSSIRPYLDLRLFWQRTPESLYGSEHVERGLDGALLCGRLTELLDQLGPGHTHIELGFIGKTCARQCRGQEHDSHRYLKDFWHRLVTATASS